MSTFRCILNVHQTAHPLASVGLIGVLLFLSEAKNGRH